MNKGFYVSVRTKFCISLVFAFLWAAFSILVAEKWILTLSEVVGRPVACLIIYGIAIIPGFINAFLILSILLDRRPGFIKSGGGGGPRKIPRNQHSDRGV